MNRAASLPGEAPRLGFAVKLLGQPGLRSHDSRRWSSGPHLRVSLDYLEQILEYLHRHRIRMYRMASGLAPYATHPARPEFHGQVQDSRERLAEIGGQARRRGVRLSFHPGQYIVLNSPDEELAQRSLADIELQGEILEAMQLDDEAVVVSHVGGLYGDRPAALERFARRVDRLSPAARRRLVVENDDSRFGVSDVLRLHQLTGLRVVFDAHHHRCYDPDQIGTAEAAAACLQTWGSNGGVRPKVHFSSPRTDWGVRDDRERQGVRRPLSAHAEFIDPFAFIDFYRPLADQAPDVMLEAKAKDLALLQLRQQLGQHAPDLAEQFQPRQAQVTE